jgi:hypothetical protein
MIMLNVSLDANNNLHVRTTSTIVRLQPAPGSYDATKRQYNPSVVSFDPARPWAVLNGTAYSRVLGWYDEGTTGANGDDFYDTYASQLAGNFVWIEKIGGSSQLKTYAVSEAGDPTGPYTPIFGTDGSSARWRWDGFMDHNVYAVSLADLTATNQIFTATYRLFIGDAEGNPVSGYGETTTTWTWQGPTVPFRPVISIRNMKTVEWPVGSARYVLEEAISSVSDNWIGVTNAILTMDGKNVVILNNPNTDRRYRLRLIP